MLRGRMTVPMQLELEVQRSTKCGDVPKDDQFQVWAEAALSGRAGGYNLAIRIVDETEALRYNRDYRDKDYATNVLSFPAELPKGLPEEVRAPQLGDLLICAPVVASEAVEQGRTIDDHWAHLVIHGVLHLLGYDHQGADEATAMESLETEILATLGISDPYIDSTLESSAS
ncbi:MAG: rRNA maturation RNase YbeY [Xanthomonadales bacterium]|nr:rRNA maturation RNase YbeY [Xanthomonadales bacterium]